MIKNLILVLIWFDLQGIIPRSELASRPLELFMCSRLDRQGYEEAFRWLAQYID